MVNSIIFLDVDGVLNSELFYERRFNEGKPEETDRFEHTVNQICKERIEWLNILCEETNAVVVISASMRKNRSLKELRKIFAAAGATFHILDKTPITGYARGTEVLKWLEANITIEKWGCDHHEFNAYAIIDDDSDYLIWQAPNFFKVDDYCGLTPNTCYKIKNFLNSFVKREYNGTKTTS